MSSPARIPMSQSRPPQADPALAAACDQALDAIWQPRSRANIKEFAIHVARQKPFSAFQTGKIEAGFSGKDGSLARNSLQGQILDYGETMEARHEALRELRSDARHRHSPAAQAQTDGTFLCHAESFQAMSAQGRAQLCATAGVGAYLKTEFGGAGEATRQQRAGIALERFFAAHAPEADAVRRELGLRDAPVPALAAATRAAFASRSAGECVRLGEALLGFALPMTETLIAQEREAHRILAAPAAKPALPPGTPPTTPAKTGTGVPERKF